jgi:hypothetical protein
MQVYSMHRGLFVGLSIEHMVLAARNDLNTSFYGYDIDLRELINGRYPRPRSAEPLYGALEALRVLEGGESRPRSLRDGAFRDAENPFHDVDEVEEPGPF